MALTTIAKVRGMTGLAVGKVPDTDITEIISQATALVNSKINIITTERLCYIDNVRKNTINGLNKTFFVNHSFNYYFGDLNNDGEITVQDIEVYLEREGERTKVTPSSIDVEGSFVLPEAPKSGTVITVRYAYTFYNITRPDKLVELLATYLASAYTYLQVEHGLSSETKFGNITIRTPKDRTSYSQYMDRFDDLLKQVNVPLNKPRIKQYKHLI